MGQSLQILFVLETSGGGSGRHVLDLAGELSQQNHSVHIIYSGTRMDSQFAFGLESLEQCRRFRIDMRRAPHPSDLTPMKRIRQYCKRCGPFHVIHGHSAKGGGIARLATIGMHAIRVYTPHAFRTMDPSLNRTLGRMYATLERWLVQNTDGIILVSDEEKEHALALGLPRSKLFVVENGIAPHFFAPRELVRQRLGLGSDELCIGFVGRFVPQKAPERVIMAFARLAPKFPSARLVMLGDGPLAHSLQELALRLGVIKRVIWRKADEGRALLPSFDIFVLPSLYEAFPYVLLEATAAGLPIVAAPVGGTCALVSNNVNGFITDHAQPELLEQAVGELLKSSTLRKKMGRASSRIVRGFTVEAMATKTLKVYERLLKRRLAAVTEANVPSI